ncbi:DnaJ C-terminal domain-containing protein [Phycicoccus sp. Root101]|uniref:DnaJ C-terminal domain-containing protein n=1 Tax=Phycicoccus sp. Root101 TaxID=1736421 RepID=UPI0007029190|nr:DnaJ C-terminal domain-containing protein [Phycicoccus sp. Root101]KQU66539.1 molecular chaperone DnaJ [Phycicoccus sp. Root101]
MARDFYEVLGLSRDADGSQIQRAYRKLARALHPDVNKDPGAEERFKELSEAYDVLSDPDQRKRYDAFGEDFRRVGPDLDPDVYRRSRGYAGAGARTGGWGGGDPSGGGFRYSGSGGDVDLEDLLGGIFGGRANGRGGRGPVAGSDHEIEVEVTVEDAYNGSERTLSISGPDGPRTIDVNIPAGVVDGQRIRLRGQGGQGSSGGAAGDLYLIVRIAAHPRYRLEGRDLHVLLPLASWEAALGSSVGIDTPGGPATVKVPAGTSSHRRLRLKGRGLPNKRGKPGDLYAEAQIKVATSPSAEERELFEQLGKVSAFDPRSSR